jgi:hypothetical protein
VRPPLRAAPLLLLLLAGAASAGEQAPGPRLDRPLGVLTPGPWRALFLDLPLQDARAHAEPLLTLRWWMANSWSISTVLLGGGRAVEVQQDEQADVVELTLHLDWARLLGEGPVARRLSTALSWRVTGHWGGWTDGLIEGWHELFRLNSFARQTVARDGVHLTLREPGGATALALTGPGMSAGDLVLRTAGRLLEGEGAAGPWALAARLDLKVPTGRLAEAGGSGGFDAGLALTASGAFLGWLTGHAQLSLARLSPLASALPLQPNPWQLGVEVGLVVHLPGGWALLAESRVLSTLFAGAWTVGSATPRQGDAVTAITRWQNQLSFGLRKDLLTLWLSEDFTLGARPEVGWRWFYDTNAPDLVVGVCLALP